MTCIVGLIDGDDVWMGADSIDAAGPYTTVRKDPKLFRNGPLLVGFTTSWRMGQILQFMDVPPNSLGVDPFEWMVRSFVPATRKALSNGGYAKKEHEQEEGGTFLVGYRSRVFAVQDDYQVAESLNPFAAVGCGWHLALGALCALQDYELEPSQLITGALQAAGRYSVVAPPFLIERLAGDSVELEPAPALLGDPKHDYWPAWPTAQLGGIF